MRSAGIIAPPTFTAVKNHNGVGNMIKSFPNQPPNTAPTTKETPTVTNA